MERFFVGTRVCPVVDFQPLRPFAQSYREASWKFTTGCGKLTLFSFILAVFDIGIWWV